MGEVNAEELVDDGVIRMYTAAIDLAFKDMRKFKAFNGKHDSKQGIILEERAASAKQFLEDMYEALTGENGKDKFKEDEVLKWLSASKSRGRKTRRSGRRNH